MSSPTALSALIGVIVLASVACGGDSTPSSPTPQSPSTSFARGSALRFDGNDLVTFGSVPPIGPHTLELWVKVDMASQSQQVFAGHNAGPSSSCGDGMWLGLDLNGLVSWVVDSTHSCGPEPHISAGSPIIGSWTHLAGTYDGATSRFYVNGALVGELSGVALAPGDWMTAGAVTFFNGHQAYFRGEMDELRLWSMARSGADISATMRVSLTGTEAGLIGYWNMNEGAGQVVDSLAPAGIPGRLGTSLSAESSDPTWVTSTVP